MLEYIDSPCTGIPFRRIDAITPVTPTPDLIQPTEIPTPASSEQHTTLPVPSADRLAEIQHEAQPQPSSCEKYKFILAVDFGTTYSSVSYVKIRDGTDTASLEVTEIQCIDNYKNVRRSNDARENLRVDNVPTEVLYLGAATSIPDSSDSDSAVDTSILEVTSENDGNSGNSRPVRRKRGRKRSAITSRKKTKSKWGRPAGVSLKWGFGVQAMQKYPQQLQSYQQCETVKLIKLSLGDDVEHLTEKRTELAEQVQRLQAWHFVRDRNHILQDYLTRLLYHAKTVLQRDAGLCDDSEVELVLCVPVSWSESACRIMHDVMVKAIQKCRLKDLKEDIISNLFIVSEPEAAAQFVLASLKETLRKGEVFILLDAGGGTVDITTYRVTSGVNGPLRLQGEMVPPDGALCGSSLISDRYAKQLKLKIQAENLPEGADIDAEVMALTNNWDLLEKPGVDIRNNKYQRRQVFVHGRHKIHWTRDEIRALFEPSLQGVIDLLDKQLRLALTRGLMVSKLIVVGGFGESPSLRGRIEEFLDTNHNSMGKRIQTLWPNAFPTSAVARGAVLRALNKNEGPSRILRSSFGIQRDEQHGTFPEHIEAGVNPTKDSMDHYPTVKETIYWMIQAHKEIPTTFTTEPIVSCHNFPSWQKKLICVERLYSSPGNHRSHFQKHHPENKGAYLLSYIEIDVSDRIDDFPLERKLNAGPRTRDKNALTRVVKFDVVIMVEGRQLRYEARWPSGAASESDVRKRKTGYVSLAPSFVPGTE